ncbi:MAG: hypothetical protein JJU41_09450 [Bacteroidetes bacterium]|nr:hypothetical protein [Bacteroidota bacterium]
MRNFGILIAFLLVTASAHAQFLQFSVFIDSEVSASTVQELNFGTMLQNSEQLIGLDENGSGWFQVAILNVSNIQLYIDAPDQLVFESDEITCGDELCGLDLELGFAYYIDSQPAIQSGRPLASLSQGFNEVAVAPPGQPNGEPEYIYVNVNVFGRLIVGDVPTGTYTGTLNLEVTF